MRSITGNYVINNTEIPFSAEIPGSWDELDAKQYARIIQMLQLNKADTYTVSASLLALLFGTSGWHILDNLPNDDLHSLVPLTNFIFEEKPPVRNYFKTLNLNKVSYLAPNDNLSNLTFGEWCFMYQFFSYYKLTNDVTWLNKLIACIYRPADPDQREDSPLYKGDLREVFNENLIEKRSKSVANVEDYMKLAVFSWFTLAIQDVMEQRPLVFPKAEPALDDVEEAEEPELDSRTWLTVFRELLGPKWGTSDQLKHTNAMFVLDALEEQQIAYKEALASMKS